MPFVYLYYHTKFIYFESNDGVIITTTCRYSVNKYKQPKLFTYHHDAVSHMMRKAQCYTNISSDENLVVLLDRLVIINITLHFILLPCISVKLHTGKGATKGRVEVHMEGTWTTVCDRHWDAQDAGTN